MRRRAWLIFGKDIIPKHNALENIKNNGKLPTTKHANASEPDRMRIGTNAIAVEG